MSRTDTIWPNIKCCEKSFSSVGLTTESWTMWC